MRRGVLKYIRDSSLTEWANAFCSRSSMRPAYPPYTGGNPVDYIKNRPDKYDPQWDNLYSSGRWCIATINLDEFKNLKAYGPKDGVGRELWKQSSDRLIGKMAQRAIEIDYFVNNNDECDHINTCNIHCIRYKHQCHIKYYDKLKSGNYYLIGNDRLFIRSSRNGYYLQDGFGRSLPYMALLLTNSVQFPAGDIEVFAVDET
jgi:hypothetical protein